MPVPARRLCRAASAGCTLPSRKAATNCCTPPHSHGWSLEGIEIFELVPPELSLDPQQEQSIVYTADLELGETLRLVMAEVERLRPTRIVFDRLAEIRLLAQSSLRYRRQVLALKYLFAKLGATGLLLDDMACPQPELNLHSIAHGVIRLEQVALQYGAERRRLRVFKMRSRQFRGGYHDFVIRRGGLIIFPRLIAAEHRLPDPRRPAGDQWRARTGHAPGRRPGPRHWDPDPGAVRRRQILGLAAVRHPGAEPGRPGSAGELRRGALGGAAPRRRPGHGPAPVHRQRAAWCWNRSIPPNTRPAKSISLVRRSVEQHDASMVVLDSLNGYQSAMLDEHFLVLQIHELLSYLNQRGIVSIMVLSQHGLVGPMHSAFDLTYVSDTVVLLRFFEAEGRIRRAISVLKKRTGGHEATIREFRIDGEGHSRRPGLGGIQRRVDRRPAFHRLGQRAARDPARWPDRPESERVLVLAPEGPRRRGDCGDACTRLASPPRACPDLAALVAELDEAEMPAPRWSRRKHWARTRRPLEAVDRRPAALVGLSLYPAEPADGTDPRGRATR